MWAGPAGETLDLAGAATDRVKHRDGDLGDWWRLRGRCTTSNLLAPRSDRLVGVIRKGDRMIPSKRDPEGDPSTASVRDAAADERDVSASTRDRAAEARDLEADQCDAEIASLSSFFGTERPTGGQIIMRAARDRQRAASDRARSAMQRVEAGADRDRAASDRVQAGEDRRVAAADRGQRGNG